MAKWARNPPSRRTVLIWGLVLLICLAFVLVESLFGWPEALTVNTGGIPKPRLSAP